jgi:hypothetical protein
MFNVTVDRQGDEFLALSTTPVRVRVRVRVRVYQYTSYILSAAHDMMCIIEALNELV